MQISNRVLPRFFTLILLIPLLHCTGVYGDDTVMKDEPIVHISVYNQTDESQNIIVFQQDVTQGLMFKKLFPIAWQVFPLPPSTDEEKQTGVTQYPPSQHIGVTREISNYLSSADLRHDQGFTRAVAPPLSWQMPLRGSVITKAKAKWGDRFEYVLSEKGEQHLIKSEDKDLDRVIKCRNHSSSLIDVNFYKMDAKIAVWKDLANGDEAQFGLKRTLFFVYDSKYKQGDIIENKITGEKVVSVDLTGYSSIKATLKYDPKSTGKKKEWKIIKR